jgi:hydrogenase maturation protease
MSSRILVAGIGNIFLGDDGFGPEVLRHVSDRLAEPEARLVDYGTGGLHLAYDLLDGWDALVLVDAVPDRGSPGTLRVFEADHDSLEGSAGLDAHGMDPATVFAILRALGRCAPHHRGRL